MGEGRGGALGQVAVSVFLPVDALQVFLLDQDVNAFLEQRKEKREERTRHHTHIGSPPRGGGGGVRPLGD